MAGSNPAIADLKCAIVAYLGCLRLISHKLLPRELWRIRVITDGQYAGTHVVASLWENPPGYVHHERIALADLPNETISGEDLGNFGIFAPR